MGCSTSTTAFDDPSQLQQQSSQQQQQQNQSLGARYVNKKSHGKQQDGDEKIVDEVLNRIGGGDEKDSAITRINGVLHGPSIHTDNIFDVAVTNNPHQILTCSDDRTIVRYDWKRGIVMDRWVGHTKCVNQVVYGDMSGVILSASRDTTIRTWSTSSSTSTSTLSGHKLSITALDICKVDNTMCVSGGRDFSVRFWDIETGRCTSMKEIQLNVVTGLCWLPQDPSCVLQISEDLEIRVWDQRSMSVVQSFQDGPYFALGCDVSPDGNTFVTSANGFQGTGCEIRIWDRRKGTLRRTLTGHTETVPSVCFMPEIRTQSGTDVCLLASGSKDQTIKLWDIDTDDACIATSSIPNSLTMQCLAQFPLASPPTSSTSTSTSKRDPMSLLYVGCVAGFVSTWSINHTRRDLHLIARSKGNEDEKK